MHEFSIANNLIKILERLQAEHHADEFFTINLTINPYSCLDEENLNFVFRSITKSEPLYRNATIRIKRGKDPASREFILEDVEISLPENSACEIDKLA